MVNNISKAKLKQELFKRNSSAFIVDNANININANK